MAQNELEKQEQILNAFEKDLADYINRDFITLQLAKNNKEIEELKSKIDLLCIENSKLDNQLWDLQSRELHIISVIQEYAK